MPVEGKFYSGTSGLNLDMPNKSHYPAAFQDKSRLEYYASRFNSIEINSSFYKLPQKRTLVRWSGETPESFKFTFKLWREITHQKELAFSPSELNKFMAAIASIGDKKGCLLVQFAPSLQANRLPRLLDLMDAIRQADPAAGWKVALEFRHTSWYQAGLLDDLAPNTTLVMQDLPKSATPFELGEAAEVVYLRFHGPEGGYRGCYSESMLEEYAGYVHAWRAQGKDVYAYFNNTMGEAARNLVTLNKLT